MMGVKGSEYVVDNGYFFGCQSLGASKHATHSPKDMTLTSFFPVGDGAGSSRISSPGTLSKARPSLPALNLDAAKDYAFRFVMRLPVGAEFTCQELFAGLAVRFDRRNLSQCLNPLRGWLIVASDKVKARREHGNDGYATLWRRVDGER